MGQVALLVAIAWLTQRLRLEPALRVARDRLPGVLVRRVEAAAGNAAERLGARARRLRVETASAGEAIEEVTP